MSSVTEKFTREPLMPQGPGQPISSDNARQLLRQLVIAYYHLERGNQWTQVGYHWERGANRLRETIEAWTGDDLHDPCPKCRGEGELFMAPLWPTVKLRRWFECWRCDGKGYLTKATEGRYCPICLEDRPEKLVRASGVTVTGWLCYDPSCGREADELRGIDPNDPTREEVAS